MSLPTIRTDAVSSILMTQVTGNGTIVNAGGLVCDKRGFVYGRNTGTLNPGNVAPSDAIVQKVDYEDRSSYQEWEESFVDRGYEEYVEDTGSFSAGAFTKDITGLDPDTTYYVRAYTHNADGYAYGDEVEVTTLAIVPLAITTDAADDVRALQATANGTITDTGGSVCDIRGFVYGKYAGTLDPGNTGPADVVTQGVLFGDGATLWGSTDDSSFSGRGYEDYTEETGSFSAEAFSLTLTGLESGTTYYIRAYAHNENGYVYGDEVTFTTDAAALLVTHDCTHGVATDDIDIQGVVSLVIHDCTHGVTMDDDVLWAASALIIDDCLHGTHVDDSLVEPKRSLNIHDCSHGVSLDDMAFSSIRNFTPKIQVGGAWKSIAATKIAIGGAWKDVQELNLYV